jgi:hypothetical protein
MRLLLPAPANVACHQLHHQYLLGFTPAAFDGKTHPIEVRVPTARAQRARARSLRSVEISGGRSERI